MTALTGRLRYRSERRRGREQLILQVEEMVQPTWRGGGKTPPAAVATWRDATTTDLTGPAVQAATGWRPFPAGATPIP